MYKTYAYRYIFFRVDVVVHVNRYWKKNIRDAPASDLLIEGRQTMLQLLHCQFAQWRLLIRSCSY